MSLTGKAAVRMQGQLSLDLASPPVWITIAVPANVDRDYDRVLYQPGVTLPPLVFEGCQGPFKANLRIEPTEDGMAAWVELIHGRRRPLRSPNVLFLDGRTRFDVGGTPVWVSFDPEVIH